MNRRLLLTGSLMALMLMGVNAQSKLSTNTRMLISEQGSKATAQQRLKKASHAKSEVLTTIMLEKGRQLSDQQLAALDIQVVSRSGSIIFANVPINRLSELADMEDVRMVDTGAQRKHQNDLSREASAVSLVHNMNVEGSASSEHPEKYRGKDVLVAIIDTDIDLAHPVFLDADGNSRIKHVMQTTPIYNSQGFVLRYEYLHYDEGNLDDAIEFSNKKEMLGDGHGSHVAGIAAGSTDCLPDSDPMKKFYGMAPESDLLLYDVRGNDSELLMAMADAIDRAEQMQRPLVMNLSFGSNSARLDGTDEFNKNLQALLDQKDMTGKLICISAGNEGGDLMSVQMDCNKPIVNNDWTVQHVLPVEPDTVASELPDGMSDMGDFEIYGGRFELTFYAADNRDFAVTYYFIDPYNHDIFYKSPRLVASETQELEKIHEDNLFAEDGEPHYSFDIETVSEITSTNRNYMHAYVDYGFGKPVLVIASIETKSEGMQIDGAIEGALFDNLSKEMTTEANSAGSINPMVCNDLVIGVGSYTTRGQITIFDQEYDLGETGAISPFSSWCDTHYYGKPNPTVATPGMMIVSSIHRNAEDGDNPIVGVSEYNGEKHLWAYMAGTSMASPAAAGIIALWLQANPQLTLSDALEVTNETSDYDDYCQDMPLRFGAGKMNAKRGIDYILGSAVGVTSVEASADMMPTKFVDADGRIKIRKGECNYNVMGVMER